jgi:hypothetical protein
MVTKAEALDDPVELVDDVPADPVAPEPVAPEPVAPVELDPVAPEPVVPVELDVVDPVEDDPLPLEDDPPPVTVSPTTSFTEVTIPLTGAVRTVSFTAF